MPSLLFSHANRAYISQTKKEEEREECENYQSKERLQQLTAVTVI